MVKFQRKTQSIIRKECVIKSIRNRRKVGLDVKTLVIEEDDQLLLCSDGLSNKVSIDDMRQILQLNEQLEGKGQCLIQLANDRGGEDNITLVLIDYAGSTNESR